MTRLLIVFFVVILVSESYSQKSNDVNWLAGTWVINTARGKMIETWKVTSDSTVAGKSFFIKINSDTIPQEQINFIFSNGSWKYIPLVQDQNEGKPVIFDIIYIKGNEFIAENPTHDFPQRISYRLIENKLYASIEGSRNGKYAKQNFDFVKEK